MKHLFYEVPVVVAGGLLFELLGQSVGDPHIDGEDISIVLRSWQSQNSLITALHVKGSSSNVNVLGIAEVQELLAAGRVDQPQSIHEVVALLASRLARWDDRLFRMSIFGEADEVELKFMNRRTHEDLRLFSIILNQEIKRLSTQVIRVKWSLHAREEIVIELLRHLRGNAARSLLEGARTSTREMIEEQKQFVVAYLQFMMPCRALFVLGCRNNVPAEEMDGMPGAEGPPYAFALFASILVLLGVVLIAIGLLYLGLRKPILEEDVAVRKIELQQLVRIFEQEAEAHAQVRKKYPSDI